MADNFSAGVTDNEWFDFLAKRSPDAHHFSLPLIFSTLFQKLSPTPSARLCLSQKGENRRGKDRSSG
jgi:hypothetical protein